MTNALQTSATAPAIAEAIETYNRIAAVRNALAPDLNDSELQLFALVAQRSGLDPFAKQIHAVKRQGKVTFQTGIDGYRSIAERTREYDGSDLPTFAAACPCDKAPKGHPEKAVVRVYRWKDGRRVSQDGEAYWHEFHPGGGQDFMWTKMPRNQLAKCAEALALRKLFPYVYADLYTDEEMAQAGPPENAAAVAAAQAPTARERIAARRQAIETGPAEEPTEGEFVEAPSEPLFDTVTAPVEGGCGWQLAPKAGERIACTLPDMHDGPHSWTDLAVREGGRVIRPAE